MYEGQKAGRNNPTTAERQSIGFRIVGFRRWRGLRCISRHLHAPVTTHSLTKTTSRQHSGPATANGVNNEASGGGDGGARKEDDDDGADSDGSSCCSGSSSSNSSGDDMSVCGPVGAGSDDDDEALMVALAKSLGDGGGDGGDKKKKKKSKEKSKWASKTDKLDLAGLLNVLDGVVDTPNRIVIMTTNHPEVSVQEIHFRTHLSRVFAATVTRERHYMYVPAVFLLVKRGIA